ncbi:MFS transporter [Streptomyces sp. SAJ15]|uniref:MFS transporter n=1 Tax=Streptomyces sp. SAJ15 TaxID=2011095 RepID=UPI001185A1AB|nr:MFS transporter [Streptomyces sp. SAJ15]TVL93763.1 MFS transporter [Streptomyces sp. SAJ15]
MSDHAPRPPRASARRNAAVLLLFTAVTNLADGVTKIALPLLAARASGSPAQVTAVSLALTLPWLLVALHVGVLVDRFDRRRLLWLADGMRLSAIGVLLHAAATGRPGIWTLCGAAVVLGVAEVIALTAAAALVPALVPEDGRERANAWLAGAETVCNEFCGPFVGGLLLAAGAGVALGATWVAYLAASLVLLLLTGRFRAARGTVESGVETGGEAEVTTGTAAGSVAVTGTATVHRQIVEGLRYLWRQRLLRTMSLILTALCACWGAWLALMPLYATETMALSSHEYGMLLSALGVGGLVGAVAVTRINRFFGRRRVMFADLVGTFAMMAVPAVTTELWAVAAAAFAGGLGGTLWSVNARTISQRIVPDVMLGRCNAVGRLFSWGAMPVGAGLVGLLAQGLGARVAFLAFAALVAVSVVPFLRVMTPAELDGGRARPAGDGVRGVPSAVSAPPR